MKLLERRVYVANVDPFVKWFGEMNIDEPNSLSSFTNLGVWQLALRLVRTPKASLHIVRQCISELPKRCTPWNYFPSWQIITSQLDLQMETSSKKNCLAFSHLPCESSQRNLNTYVWVYYGLFCIYWSLLPHLNWHTWPSLGFVADLPGDWRT